MSLFILYCTVNNFTISGFFSTKYSNKDFEKYFSAFFDITVGGNWSGSPANTALFPCNNAIHDDISIPCPASSIMTKSKLSFMVLERSQVLKIILVDENSNFT